MGVAGSHRVELAGEGQVFKIFGQGPVDRGLDCVGPFARKFDDRVEHDLSVQKVDDDCAVDDVKVVAGAAVQGVNPGATVQLIIAGSAIEQVAQDLLARQGVVEVRADQVLDAPKDIAGCVAARAKARGEVDANARRGTGVGYRVIAIVAGDGVGPSAAHKEVVAVVAGQAVGPKAANHVFHAAKDVARSIPTAGGEGFKVDDDTQGRGRIIQRVDAAKAGHAVCPGTALEDVVVGIACDGVVESGTSHTLDRQQGIGSVAAGYGRA